MPEGPEIRRAADRVARAIQGQVAEEVFFAFEDLKPFEERLRGRRVREVTTRGKAMLTAFEGDYVVYSHNQLYGRWYTRRRGSLPDTTRQLRFGVHTPSSSALLYSASEIEVLPADQLARHPFLAKLGPDALDAAITPRIVRDRLASRAFRGRQLGAVLLDQGFVAGLGNYLRAEIAYTAGVLPTRRAVDLDPRQRLALARAVLTVTRRSYRTGGITNPERLARRLQRAGHPRRHYRHAVFGRAGHPCWTCGAEIEREDVGGRSSFHCPTCQG